MSSASIISQIIHNPTLPFPELLHLHPSIKEIDIDSNLTDDAGPMRQFV